MTVRIINPEFRCKVCDKETIIAPADGSEAVCPDHCEDHFYEYERGEGWMCKHCGAQPPHDWWGYDSE
jgi:hypothetical protein